MFLSCFLSVSVSLSLGDYEVSVKFNEQHIPDSPYLVPVVAPENDARRLTVTGLQVRHEEMPQTHSLPCAARHRGSSCVKHHFIQLVPLDMRDSQSAQTDTDT